MKKVIVLTGPTGVGKTKTALEIAKHLNTDIINGDAFQIQKSLIVEQIKLKRKLKLIEIKKLQKNIQY